MPMQKGLSLKKGLWMWGWILISWNQTPKKSSCGVIVFPRRPTRSHEDAPGGEGVELGGQAKAQKFPNQEPRRIRIEV